MASVGDLAGLADLRDLKCLCRNGLLRSKCQRSPTRALGQMSPEHFLELCLHLPLPFSFIDSLSITPIGAAQESIDLNVHVVVRREHVFNFLIASVPAKLVLYEVVHLV